jgi:integrase
MTRGAGRKNRQVGTFGSVDSLATGYRARYYGPDGVRYRAPVLFPTKAAARTWLSLRHSEIVRNAWMPPEALHRTAKLTLATYADQWLAQRDLKERTREHYRKLLDQHIMPALGSAPVSSLTAEGVKQWYSDLDKSTPTLRSHAYGLLRTIMGSAVSDGKAPVNPCVLRGASTTKRAHKIRPASLVELEKITAAMPEQYRAMILLASWCALRFGELTELRRRDIELAQYSQDGATVHAGLIRVERGVVRTGDGFTVTTPKSEAGTRDVAIPPHLCPLIADHLAKFVGPEPDSLLFPAHHGGHLAPTTLKRHFYRARDAASRPDLHFHDLRHSGAVLAALTGATLAELMSRLGHSTPAAAMRYQHAAQGRDQAIAEALSRIASGGT